MASAMARLLIAAVVHVVARRRGEAEERGSGGRVGLEDHQARIHQDISAAGCAVMLRVPYCGGRLGA